MESMMFMGGVTFSELRFLEISLCSRPPKSDVNRKVEIPMCFGTQEKERSYSIIADFPHNSGPRIRGLSQVSDHW